MPAPDSLAVLGYGLACVFGAAVVRGYSGFGFSMLSITALALVLPPVETVPAVLMLELAASLHLLPAVRRHVDWRAIGLLLLGGLAGTPVGVWALAAVPAPPMRMALAAVVVVTALLLLRGHALRRAPGPAATLATGAASGLLNGAFGMAGPPVILFFLSSPAGAAAGRASLIAYFLGTDIVALGFLARQDLIGAEHLLRFLVLLPALFAGVWLGARSFGRADPDAFRRAVLWLLIGLAALTGAQGAIQLGLFSGS